MAETRIYLVSDLSVDPVVHRLVRAPTAAQARNHVIGTRYVSDVATQESIAELVGAGMKVETAAGRAVAE